MPPSDGYWRFCDIIERRRVPRKIITAPPETERVVLEQHTITGEYRFRPFRAVTEQADGRGG